MMDCDTSKTSANEEGFVLVHYLILGASCFVMVFLSVIAGFMLRRCENHVFVEAGALF